VDKYDTLKYSRVKAIMVSMRLQNFLCTLTITNSQEGQEDLEAQEEECEQG
jgi:hypothetical protein